MFWAPLLAAALDLATAVSVATTPATTVPVPSATPSAGPATGDKAPDFVYQSYDYMRRRFHDMLDQGAVLIVFAPSEAELRQIESDRDAMLARGVFPVAVVERSDRDVWKLVRRLDLSYSLLSDPRGTIASEFGAWDGPHTHPAWFVVGTDGRIRASAHGEMRRGDWAATAFAALGLSGEGDVRPTGAVRGR